MAKQPRQCSAPREFATEPAPKRRANRYPDKISGATMTRLPQTLACFLLSVITLAGSAPGVDVHVTKCQVRQGEELIVKKQKKTIVWKSTDKAYLITFAQKLNPSGNDITPFLTSQPPHTLTVPAGRKAKWDTHHLDPRNTTSMLTPANCGETPSGAVAGCQFTYTISTVSGVCSDPSIHIIPETSAVQLP
jgi:hypothetical protein